MGRSRNENEGANGPVDQRDDYKETQKTCDRLYKKYMQQQQEMSTQEFILEIKFDKDRNHNSKDMRMIFIVLI